MYFSNFLIMLLPLASIASSASDIRAVQKVVENFLASEEGIRKVQEMLVISLDNTISKMKLNIYKTPLRVNESHRQATSNVNGVCVPPIRHRTLYTTGKPRNNQEESIKRSNQQALYQSLAMDRIRRPHRLMNKNTLLRVLFPHRLLDATRRRVVSHMFSTRQSRYWGKPRTKC